MSTHIAHCVHQRARAAAIDVYAGSGLFEHRPEVEGVRRVAAVVMQHGACAAECRNFVAIRRARGITREVIKLERYRLWFERFFVTLERAHHA